MPQTERSNLTIDLDVLLTEPADQYHAKSGQYLSSHQLLDFMACPWLYRKKQLGLIAGTDTQALLVGRATHCRILEGRDTYESQFAIGGPINPKTNRPFGSATKAFAEWATAQNKPVLSLEQVELIEQMAAGVAMNDEAVDLLMHGRAEGVVRASYVETRGEGGLFLCAPTPGYELVQGSLTDLPILTPAERDILLSAAWSLNEYVPENPFHAECLKVTQRLQEAPGQQLAHSILLKRMKMDAKGFAELISTLEQSGDVETVVVPRAGTPSKHYRLVKREG